MEGRKCASKASCLTDEAKINHISPHRIPRSQQCFLQRWYWCEKAVTWTLKLQALEKSVNRMKYFEPKNSCPTIF